MDDEILLHGSFQQFPECKQFYSVTLGRQNLIYGEKQFVGTLRRQSLGFTSILLKDILNVVLFQSKLKQDIASYFKIISYLPMGRKRKRKRIMITFRVCESDDEQENLLTAEVWTRTLHWLLVNPKLEREVLQAKEDFPPRKRLLVLINPKSGPGKSLKLFREKVEPMFREAGVQYEEFVTEQASQGMDIAYNLDLGKWDGIVICSGDGLAYEVINGFMQREDWEKAIKMPIGMIPTGSGNALCASVLYTSGEPWDFTSSIYVVLRGQSKPMDLCSMTNSKRHCYAFLSLTWGLISDVDIESERFRMLGTARFTVGAVSRILSLRTYHGRISYLLADNISSESHSSMSTDVQSVNRHSQDRNKGMMEVEENALEDNDIEISTAEGSDNLAPLLPSTTSTFKKASNVDMEPVSFTAEDDSDSVKMKGRDHTRHHSLVSMKNQFTNQRYRRAISSAGLDAYQHTQPHSVKELVKPPPLREEHGPLDSLLVPLSNDLPDNWVQLNGKFVTVIVLLISHLGSDLLSVPHAKLNDGYMYILYVKKGASRKSLIDILTSMETGDHLKNPDIVIAKIRAFRVEPAFERSGYIAVDGELVEYGSMQGQIHNGLARVFSL